MERKIGEIFEHNGEWYQCLRTPYDYIGNICKLCSFSVGANCISNYQCIGAKRKDNIDVFFKKLEKVGEPYDFQKRTFQTYKLYTIPFLSEDVELVAIPSKDNNTIEIEIKQNKEDMEEGKLDPHMEKVIDEATQKMGEEIGRQIEANINKQRMKPFNLEAAKAGKPVCTRDGRKARIICFDKKKDIYPLIALVTDKDGYEIITSYKADGVHPTIPNDDLMMLPEKKGGWINIYKEGVDQYIYTNEKAALSRRGSDCIATIKIEWEE